MMKLAKTANINANERQKVQWQEIVLSWFDEQTSNRLVNRRNERPRYGHDVFKLTP
jgi:hypothetical protein